MRLDHPADPTGPVATCLDRRGTQGEQARSVWSRPVRRGAPGYGAGDRRSDHSTERAWKPSSRPQETIRHRQFRMTGSSSSLFMTETPETMRHTWSFTASARYYHGYMTV